MIDRVFAALESHLPGADLPTLSVATGETQERLAVALEAAISEGILERWPFWPERIRSTGQAAPAFLRELAELRRQALAHLERINEASLWPATLHLLVPGAHTVVERFPWHGDPEAMSRERAHYARPRPLTEGATSMAIVAHLPDAAREAFLGRHVLADRAPLIAAIRTQGFCLRPATSLVGGWVLSAPLLTSDGLPYGALCTYGSAATLSEGFVERCSGLVHRCAWELSQSAAVEVLALRARAIIEELVQGGVSALRTQR
jgi:DNA-binding IclR family transcriptional regulator